MVGRERARGGPAIKRLEDGRLHLQKALLDEEAAHRLDDDGPLAEGLADLGVDDEVDIALAVALFGVGESVVDFAVLLFGEGQRAQALAQERQRLDVKRHLAHLGAEHKALNANEITAVNERLKHLAKKVREGLCGQIVLGAIQLDAPRAVLELDEGRLTHQTALHEAAGKAHFG